MKAWRNKPLVLVTDSDWILYKFCLWFCVFAKGGATVSVKMYHFAPCLLNEPKAKSVNQFKMCITISLLDQLKGQKTSASCRDPDSSSNKYFLKNAKRQGERKGKTALLISIPNKQSSMHARAPSVLLWNYFSSSRLPWYCFSPSHPLYQNTMSVAIVFCTLRIPVEIG